MKVANHLWSYITNDALHKYFDSSAHFSQEIGYWLPLLIFGKLFFLALYFFFVQEIGVLRQQILASEGELRSVSSPAYTAKDRDKAVAEQSVSFSNNSTFWHVMSFSWLTICSLSCGRCSKECVVFLLAFLLLCCIVAFLISFCHYLCLITFCPLLTDTIPWPRVTWVTRSDPEWNVEMDSVSNAHVQACRERIKGLQSKITAFSQRINLIQQRGTPDQEQMRRDWPIRAQYSGHVTSTDQSGAEENEEGTWCCDEASNKTCLLLFQLSTVGALNILYYIFYKSL